MRSRRLRGFLLRLAFKRWFALAAGLALLAAAWALFAKEYAWETWLTDGLGLVSAATGAALIVMAIGGRRPDWIDPDANRDRSHAE